MHGALTYLVHSGVSDHAVLRLRWFDFWLKRKDTGATDVPCWRASDTYGTRPAGGGATVPEQRLAHRAAPVAGGDADCLLPAA